ncbi:hypothetical protein NMG60_11003335 [Bertholletia excelsa]
MLATKTSFIVHSVYLLSSRSPFLILPMARLSVVLLVLVALFLCCPPIFEARKLLSMEKKVASLKGALDALPKGTVPTSAPSGEDVNGRQRVSRPLPRTDRVLTYSVPSPGIGH